MNQRTWVIDLVLMFRLATAKADEPHGPITLELDHSNDDLNEMEEVFQKGLLDGIAWIRNPSCRMF
jgi:hypothetical protein